MNDIFFQQPLIIKLVFFQKFHIDMIPSCRKLCDAQDIFSLTQFKPNFFCDMEIRLLSCYCDS